MARLQIFIDKTPIYSGNNIYLRAGFFADDYSLTDVTSDCSFTINFGDENITKVSDNLFFTNKSGDAGIKAFYAIPANKLQQDRVQEEYIATTSFVIISEASLPNNDDIYACIKREEPDGAYTQVADPESFTYLDNQATANIFATLYKNLETETNQIYPELSTDYTDWINMLFSEVYINTEQGQINRVLQLLRNLQILTSMNPFDIASAITSYIYYRTNLAMYVFIQEDKVNFDRAWILGTNKSILGVNTYLSSGKINTDLIINIFDTEHQLSDLFRIELDNFISKLARAYFDYTVEYDKNPEDFHLHTDIGMSYKSDQRIIYSYCLKYSEPAFYKVIGLINPIQPEYIKDILIAPPDGTVISVLTKFTLTGVFIDGISADITLSSQIKKDNDNLKVIGDVLIPNKNGECTLTISYGEVTKTVTYISKVS